MTEATTDRIQPHNARPSAVWSAGGKEYDEVSRGIADSIEHCVTRLNPQPGERILDLGDRDRLDVARRRTPRRDGDRRRHRERPPRRGTSPGRRGKAADSVPARGRRESAFRGRSVRRCRVDVRNHVRHPSRGRGRRARPGLPQGRPDRAHGLAVGRQPLQDVRGHEKVHASAAEPGPAVTVRMGPYRAHPRIAGERLPAPVRAGDSGTTASRAARQPGRRSRQATDRRGRLRPASTRSGAKRCTRTSPRSTRAFPRSSASACRANTG